MGAYLKAGMRGPTIFRIASGRLLPPPERVEWRASEAFRVFLRGMAEAWFRDYEIEGVQHYGWKSAGDWQSLFADLATPPSEEAMEAESGVGDDQVKLYQVRTPLSRYLYGNDTDCVIHILRPVDEVDAGIVLTMQRCVAQLNLQKKRRVNFRFHWKSAAVANQAIEEFCGEHVWKDLLGFKTWRRSIWH
jgi:hypothetical protein